MKAWVWGRRSLRAWVGLGLALLAASGTASAQQATDAALRDRVRQLVDRLGSDKAEAREAAEASLVKLGASILPLLPSEADAPKERKEQLARIRAAVESGRRPDDPKPQRFSLVGKGIRLSEALMQIQKQTGNPITDLREQLDGEAGNPSLDLDLKDATFYQALDEVARKAGVSISPYTNDGSVGLTSDKPAEKGLVQYVDSFRISLREIVEKRDYQTGTTTANAAFEISWEPRLRPMLLSLKTDKLVFKDDQGRALEPMASNDETEVVLRPENPVVDVNINVKAPERSAVRLAEATIRAEVTFPAGVKTFRFPSLAAENVELKQGDVSVTLQKTEIDEQVWKIEVVLDYPGGGPAFESYRQGLFNNRLWLERQDGSRFEHNGGYSNMSAEGAKMGFEYLFVDVPGKLADYRFVYETPSRVVVAPLEFTFKDVPLP